MVFPVGSDFMRQHEAVINNRGTDPNARLKEIRFWWLKTALVRRGGQTQCYANGFNFAADWCVPANFPQ